MKPGRFEGRRSKGERWTIGNIGKWLALGSEVPIMVLAGVFVGRYLGERFGEPTSVFWIIVGAVLGLLVGAYNIVKIVRIWEAREAAVKARTGKRSRRSEFNAYTNREEHSFKKSDVSEDEEKWQRVIGLLKEQMMLDESFQTSKDENSEEA